MYLISYLSHPDLLYTLEQARKNHYGNRSSRSNISWTVILCSCHHGDRWRIFSLMWIREKKTIALALLGGIILFVYGIIPTL